MKLAARGIMIYDIVNKDSKSATAPFSVLGWVSIIIMDKRIQQESIMGSVTKHRPMSVCGTA